MGAEPLIEALDNGVDVIVAGRSCDSAIFASYAIWKGFDRGLALHMGKILECGAMCAMPPTGRDAAIGVLRREDFILESPNPDRRVVPRTVAGHMVYEVEHPFLHEGTDGNTGFLGGRNGTGVQRDRHPCLGNQISAEGEAHACASKGRSFGGIAPLYWGRSRDPFLIQQLDSYIDGCTRGASETWSRINSTSSSTGSVYGRDAVLGRAEPMRQRRDLHEVGILAQVLAPTQERAHDVAALLEARMIGFAYEGARTRTAHIAFPFSPAHRRQWRRLPLRCPAHSRARRLRRGPEPVPDRLP